MDYKTHISVTGVIEKKAELGVGVNVIVNSGKYSSKVDGTPNCEKLLIPLQFEGEIAEDSVNANPGIGDKIKVEGHLKYAEHLDCKADGTRNGILVYVDQIVD